MKRYIYISAALILLLAVHSGTFAQKKRWVKAEEAFEAGEYFDAIDLYKDAYAAIQDRSLKTEIVFKIAECYRLTNAPDKAELWYKKAIGQDYPDPVVILNYAETLKKNDKYEEALICAYGE